MLGTEMESESEGGGNSGWQQCFGVGLEKKGVAIHGMSKVEGGTGHCANQSRPERLRGAVEENSQLELGGDIRVGLYSQAGRRVDGKT